MGKNDGGPAFPKTEYDGDKDAPVNQTKGMSLRDYFAAAALQGWLASWPSNSSQPSRESAVKMANLSYELADAMLEVRQQ